MKRGEKYLLGLTLGLGCCAAAEAVVNDTDHPYKPITVRNVFALKDPPPPPTTEAPPPPPSNIKLSGITDILGRKQVLLVLNESARPGQPVSQPQFLILTEGETQGQVKVLEIDQKGGSVKLVNAGVSQSLNFEKDGVKPPSGPAPGAAPVAGGLPPVPGQPQPNAIPAGSLPQQQPVGGGGGVTSIGGAQGASTAYSSLKEIPTRPVRTPTAGSPGVIGAQPQSASPAQNMSPEEQMILMETHRLMDGKTGHLIPPTPLTPK